MCFTTVQICPPSSSSAAYHSPASHSCAHLLYDTTPVSPTTSFIFNGLSEFQKARY